MSRNEHKASNGVKTCLVHKTDMALVCVLPLEFIKKIAEEPKTELLSFRVKIIVLVVS